MPPSSSKLNMSNQCMNYTMKQVKNLTWQQNPYAQNQKKVHYGWNITSNILHNNKKSRQVEARLNKWKYCKSKLESRLANCFQKFTNNLISKYRRLLWNNFGFIPDTNKSFSQNYKIIRCQQHIHPPSKPDPSQQPQNRSCHNLCSEDVEIPYGANKLLGLCLNDCIEKSQPEKGQQIAPTMTQLIWDICLGVYFGNFDSSTTTNNNHNKNNDTINNYDPVLYV